VQHVIHSRELPRGLDRNDVVGLLDHAQHGSVPARIAAHRAQLPFADVVADLAQPQLVLHVE